MNGWVVIPTVAANEYLRGAISSCIETGTPAENIVVVVDGDSSQPGIDEMQLPSGVVVVPRKHSGGFAAACNEGARHIADQLRRGGDVDLSYHAVLFLNDDAKLMSPTGWSQSLDVISDRSVGACSLTIEGPSGSRQDYPATIRAVGKVHDGPTLSGAAFSMRLSTFMEFGGLDEGFRMYGEETDLYVRLQASDLLLVESAEVAWHHGEGTMGSRRYASAWHSMKAPIRVAWLNYGIAGIVRSYAALFVHVWLPKTGSRAAEPHVSRKRGVAWLVRVLMALAVTGSSIITLPQVVSVRRRRRIPNAR